MLHHHHPEKQSETEPRSVHVTSAGIGVDRLVDGVSPIVARDETRRVNPASVNAAVKLRANGVELGIGEPGTPSVVLIAMGDVLDISPL